ncbi:MAG: hypothetical protein ACYS8I_13205, partial [Planctomycetota bacterium]
ISAMGETRIYFLQDRQESWADMVCVYEGDLTSNPAVIDNVDLSYGEPNLQLFRFYPQGVDRDFAGHEYSARQSGITIVEQRGRLILLLDQLFSRGGSGGHRDLIARKYMTVQAGIVQVAGDYSIVTDFTISYPRYYGGGEWSKGRISYYHCFDHELSVEGNKLVVSFRKHEFELEPLFATADEVTPEPEQGSWWGERFRYNDFLLPREAEVQEVREKDDLELQALFVR